MTRALGALLFAAALASLPACESGPYCGEFVDATGRRVAFCQSPRQDPVCDLPGEESRFEEDLSGRIVLAGGLRARCNEDGEVVCAEGTEGVPYCITDPEL